MGSLRDPRPDLPHAGGQWSRYWRSGALHSCTCAFDDNYEGAVVTFWTEQIKGLRQGATIVDLGSGNGAIPLLLKRKLTENGLTAQIHGVDLADIDPRATVPHGQALFAGIRFHPGVAMTQLPFADGVVDLVTGQYALEYADLEPATREIARVIGDTGCAAFVLHSRDSILATTTVEQLETCSFLLDRSNLYPAARDMATALARGTTPETRARLTADTRAQQQRLHLNEAAASLLQRIDVVKTPDIMQVALTQVSDALKAASTGIEATAMALLDTSEAAFRDEWHRLGDLHTAALSAERISWLRDRFVALGYRSDFGRLQHDDGQVLGWTLSVH